MCLVFVRSQASLTHPKHPRFLKIYVILQYTQDMIRRFLAENLLDKLVHTVTKDR